MPTNNDDGDTARLLYESYFHAGITACLRSWPVLRTAVERGWGSPDAANDLRTNLVQNRHLDPTDLADAIAVYMEEEFSVTLEDQSETSIASMVARLYQDCVVQRRTTVLQEVLTAATAATTIVGAEPSRIQVVQPSEFDDDDEDDDMVLDSSTTATATTPAPLPALSQWTPESLAAYGQAPLFGPAPTRRPTTTAAPVRQLGQAAPATTNDTTMHVVDDDGFAPVVTRKKRSTTTATPPQ